MLKFLIDEDIPRSVAEVIKNHGFECWDVKDCGLRGKSDDEIFKFAQKENAIIFTMNMELGNYLKFPVRENTGVVVAHFSNEMPVSELNNQIVNAFNSLTEKDFKGNLIILEHKRIRKKRITFEKFIVERFLDFYNKDKNTNFVILYKRDDVYRNKPAYDYHCEDIKTKKKMGIEVKRLIAKDKGKKANIKNWFNKYVKSSLQGKLKGRFWLIINLHEFPMIRGSKKINLFEKIRSEILSVQNKKNNTNLVKLSCCRGICLFKESSQGSDINFYLLSFASAREREIKRILLRALEKFKKDFNPDRINIILLVELIIASRREDIRCQIQLLKEGLDEGIERKGDFSMINEIYHIGVSPKPTITQVYPLETVSESFLFSPEDYMPLERFKKCCLNYLT